MHPLLPAKGAKVVVAMSGGVDSSVAAGWLKSQGYDVIGITLQLHDMAERVENKFGTCCSLSDISDARRVAERLEIPFYVTDMEQAFEESVVDDFVDEYLEGRTPNPCVRCNEKVKFNKLMDWAMDLGADFLATGHYARIRYNLKSEQHELVKGDDPGKDQSYFLFTLKQSDLSRTLFPIGSFEKSAVRELAKQYDFGRVAHKPDSQEICFVQGQTYSQFIEGRLTPDQLPEGAIVDESGNELGRHKGLHQFTIGQRKGLGVFAKEPLFVLKMDRSRNEVVVGPESRLYQRQATVKNLNWIHGPLQGTQKYAAKIRYRSKESAVEVKPTSENEVEVLFDTPQRAITPGQAMVFYDGDRVMGGGWIERMV